MIFDRNSGRLWTTTTAIGQSTTRAAWLEGGRGCQFARTCENVSKTAPKTNNTHVPIGLDITIRTAASRIEFRVSFGKKSYRPLPNPSYSTPVRCRARRTARNNGRDFRKRARYTTAPTRRRIVAPLFRPLFFTIIGARGRYNTHLRTTERPTEPVHTLSLLFVAGQLTRARNLAGERRRRVRIWRPARRTTRDARGNNTRWRRNDAVRNNGRVNA